MNNETVFLTRDKKESLEVELKYLKNEKRREVIDAIESAKALGDLSENAEYHQAREEQGHLEDRIMEIEDILRRSKIVSHRKSDTVEIGSSLSVKKEDDGKTMNITIVGSEEADTESGKISINSPLGQSLLGKKKGDKAEFETPKGKNIYTILKVE